MELRELQSYRESYEESYIVTDIMCRSKFLVKQ